MVPSIRYLVSSPYGDIPADKKKWDLPLEGDELKTSYKIYFHSIKNFLLKDDLKPLLPIISKKTGKEIHFKEIYEIIVRSEKHGVLYHPASIEFILKGEKIKFGLNVAISDTGRVWLRKEFDTLQKLHSKFDLPYLPRVYFLGDANAMSFLLEDWFESYHEFHISIDKDGTQRLKLWDFDKGYRYLSPEQSFEIYKQVSQILTLYYDLKNFSQILAWHHAAGDFVVRIEDKAIGHPHPNPPPSRGRADRESPSSRESESISFADKYPLSTGGRGLGGGVINVRLTTVRRYEPFIGFTDKEALNPILALYYYFLNLTIRMRLDKLDGMGEVIWADDKCLEATLIGFFEVLKLKGDLKHYLNLNRAEDFLMLLQTFSQEELKSIINPLIDQYRNTNDSPVIIANLDKHIEEIYTTLQNLPL